MKDVKKTSEALQTFTSEIASRPGPIYVKLCERRGQLIEMSATIRGVISSTKAKTEGVGRLVSLALKQGIELEGIINQLKGLGSGDNFFKEKGVNWQCPCYRLVP